MTNKKRILIVIDWFLPGFKAGGQIRSCHNLIRLLQHLYDFDVFTSDRDMGDNEPYPGIKVNEWNPHPEGFRVFYASGNKTRLAFLWVLQQHNYHLFYFNSLFSYRFSILPLLLIRLHNIRCKIVLAPRGMMGRGALQIKKFKKSVFIALSRFTGLYKNTNWHATSDLEAAEIKEIMGPLAPVHVATDTGTVQKVDYHPKQKQAGSLELIFVSRLSRKKNLDYALHTLAGVAPGFHINFHIYGPVEEPEYWQTCQTIIGQLSAHINVHYHGEVQPAQVIALFQQSHLFFFPTLHENFGHVIHESLLGSCPVLLSDQTPWLDLEKTHAGFSLPLSDKDAFISHIEKFASMNQEEYNHWAKGASETAANFGFNEELVARYKILFD